ncbi:polysaccharide deacetylase family protein [Bacillus kwashiorkori]|uniref:polysaccharide deacetylase family protein n=1 Tax=Bacillus kwashiorkori TaxID=1522318 RepID=UPI0007838BE8|nr:polysaccharide deacetylase family protein [Bacillus kwashiorkori]
MNYFLIINGKRLKSFSIILLTAFVTAWFIYIQDNTLPVFSTSDGPKAVYKGKDGVALTFNIGWGDENAEPIVDLLIKNNIKSATFFLSGSWAERQPDLVNKMVKHGYDIGLLGYEYKDYKDLEDVEIRRDILKAEQVFKKMGVKHKKILRSPTGHFDKRLLKISNQLGYTVFHWNINTEDWKNPGVKEIVSKVKKAKTGDIILLHASDSAKQTIIALPEILQVLKENGLKLVSATEMMIDGKAKTNEVN